MELKNAKKSDYKASLMNLGLYEQGMKLEEMKQVMQALEESELECETVFFESDLERALKESELDCALMQCEIHSSTLIEPNHNSNRDILRQFPQRPFIFDSPEIASEKIIVKAIVHHDLNYSPSQAKREFEKPLQHNFKLPSKTYNQNGNTLKNKMEENENTEVLIIKRSRLVTTSSPKIDRNNFAINSNCDYEDLSQITNDSHSDPSF